MQVGALIIVDNIPYIAVNIPGIPRESDYYNLDQTHFDADRYKKDVNAWQSLVDQADKIQVSYGDIDSRLFQVPTSAFHGRKVTYTQSADKKWFLSIKIILEQQYDMSMRQIVPKCVNTDILFIISRYKEDVSWVEEFTENHLVINKGPLIIDYEPKAHLNRINVGGNQFDICRYIVDNYKCLPAVMCFVQGDPFDHCNKETLKRLCNNTFFTPLESYEHLPETEAHKKDVDGGYMEINNSWFISAHNLKLLGENHEITCKFDSYDDFMNSLFSNYQHVDWIRFTPGSQYIVTKEDCLRYSKTFWQHLMNIFPFTDVNGGTEAHLVERALWYIFKGTYTARY